MIRVIFEGFDKNGMQAARVRLRGRMKATRGASTYTSMNPSVCPAAQMREQGENCNKRKRGERGSGDSHCRAVRRSCWC